MPLSEQDKQELKEGILEVYEELFSTQIQFLIYDEENNTPDSEYYEEQKYKEFLDPIPLSGRVRMYSEDEVITPSGVKQDWDATFSIPILALERTNILQLGRELILKSRIRYQDLTFDIADFQPEMNVADIFLRYVIKGKKVDDYEEYYEEYEPEEPPIEEPEEGEENE